MPKRPTPKAQLPEDPIERSEHIEIIAHACQFTTKEQVSHRDKLKMAREIMEDDGDYALPPPPSILPISTSPDKPKKTRSAMLKLTKRFSEQQVVDRGELRVLFQKHGMSLQRFVELTVEAMTATKKTRLAIKGEVQEYDDPDWTARAAARKHFSELTGLDSLEQPSTELSILKEIGNDELAFLAGGLTGGIEAEITTARNERALEEQPAPVGEDAEGPDRSAVLPAPSAPDDEGLSEL